MALPDLFQFMSMRLETLHIDRIALNYMESDT